MKQHKRFGGLCLCGGHSGDGISESVFAAMVRHFLRPMVFVLGFDRWRTQDNSLIAWRNYAFTGYLASAG